VADIASELKTYLKTISDITDVIGATTAARINLHLARQKWTENGAVPYIVYHVLTDTSHEDLTGESGLIISQIQIDCYGTTSAQAYSLAELVRTALMITNGAGRYTMGSTYIHSVSSVGGYERDFVPPPQGRDVPTAWVYSRDYRLGYAE